MNAYELARLLPPTWEYGSSVIPVVVLAMFAIAGAPLAAVLVRRLAAILASPCGDPPSLPAKPVKPRLA